MEDQTPQPTNPVQPVSAPLSQNAQAYITQQATQIIKGYTSQFNFYDLKNEANANAYQQMQGELNSIHPGTSWTPQPITNRDQFNALYADGRAERDVSWFHTMEQQDQELSAKEKASEPPTFWNSNVVGKTVSGLASVPWDLGKSLVNFGIGAIKAPFTGTASAYNESWAEIDQMYKDHPEWLDGSGGLARVGEELKRNPLSLMAAAGLSDIAGMFTGAYGAVRGLADKAESSALGAFGAGDGATAINARWDAYKSNMQVQRADHAVQNFFNLNTPGAQKVAADLDPLVQLATFEVGGAAVGAAKGAMGAVRQSFVDNAFAPVRATANRAIDQSLIYKSAITHFDNLMGTMDEGNALVADASSAQGTLGGQVLNGQIKEVFSGLPDEQVNSIIGSLKFGEPTMSDMGRIRQELYRQSAAADAMRDQALKAVDSHMTSLQAGRLSYADAYAGTSLEKYGSVIDKAIQTKDVLSNAPIIKQAMQIGDVYAKVAKLPMADYLGKATAYTALPLGGLIYGGITGGIGAGVRDAAMMAGLEMSPSLIKRGFQLFKSGSIGQEVAGMTVAREAQAQTVKNLESQVAASAKQNPLNLNPLPLKQAADNLNSANRTVSELQSQIRQHEQDIASAPTPAENATGAKGTPNPTIRAKAVAEKQLGDAQSTQAQANAQYQHAHIVDQLATAKDTLAGHDVKIAAKNASKAYNDSLSNQKNNSFVNRAASASTSAYQGMGKPVKWAVKGAFAIPGVSTFTKGALVGGTANVALNSLDAHPTQDNWDAFHAGAMTGGIASLVLTHHGVSDLSKTMSGKVYKITHDDADGGITKSADTPKPQGPQGGGGAPKPVISTDPNKPVIVSHGQVARMEVHQQDLGFAEIKPNGEVHINQLKENPPGQEGGAPGATPKPTEPTPGAGSPGSNALPGVVPEKMVSVDAQGNQHINFTLHNDKAVADVAERNPDTHIYHNPVAGHTYSSDAGTAAPEGYTHIGTAASVTADGGVKAAYSKAIADPVGKAVREMLAPKPAAPTPAPAVAVKDQIMGSTITKLDKRRAEGIVPEQLTQNGLGWADTSSKVVVRGDVKDTLPDHAHIDTTKRADNKSKGDAINRNLDSSLGSIGKDAEITGIANPAGNRTMTTGKVAIINGDRAVPVEYIKIGAEKAGPGGRMFTYADGNSVRVAFADKDGNIQLNARTTDASLTVRTQADKASLVPTKLGISDLTAKATPAEAPATAPEAPTAPIHTEKPATMTTPTTEDVDRRKARLYTQDPATVDAIEKAHPENWTPEQAKAVYNASTTPVEGTQVTPGTGNLREAKEPHALISQMRKTPEAFKGIYSANLTDGEGKIIKNAKGENQVVFGSKKNIADWPNAENVKHVIDK